jgi:hypothetical protein
MTCLNYFAGIQELLLTTVNYYELLWITVNCLNNSKLLGTTLNYLDFSLFFLTGLMVFQMGYLNFSTGLCLCYVFYWFFCPKFLYIIESSLISAGLLFFLLGHLGLSTGFCCFFWQLNRSELIWITLHYLAAVEWNINLHIFALKVDIMLISKTTSTSPNH